LNYLGEKMPHDDFSKIDEEYFETVLDEDFRFEGTIKHADSLIIKGYIKGKIESEKVLIIGPNAVVDADISVKNLQCFGKINGNVIVQDEAYFHFPSSLNGDLTTPVLTFEKGCVLNGTVRMHPKKEEVKKENKNEV
jgi:cytoskeletal protein CcmA (bactofilin family)